MPSLVDKAVFNFLLHKNKTVEDVFEFCAKDNRCKENNQTVAKYLLNLTGYKTGSSKFDYKDIFKELAQLAIIAKKESHGINFKIPFELTSQMKKIVANYGSDNMRKFMCYNGFDAEKEYPGVTQKKYKEDQSMLKTSVIE
jgi:hypothetical protein